jgi:crotonobetainyl-CoA:carnitine CoA-transferase CaiB-like acyl-CoA transferase
VQRFPVEFSDTYEPVRRHPPLLGEQETEVLEELGYSKPQIKKLKSGNVI